jgi:hypothetical protein
MINEPALPKEKFYDLTRHRVVEVQLSVLRQKYAQCEAALAALPRDSKRPTAQSSPEVVLELHAESMSLQHQKNLLREELEGVGRTLSSLNRERLNLELHKQAISQAISILRECAPLKGSVVVHMPDEVNEDSANSPETFGAILYIGELALFQSVDPDSGVSDRFTLTKIGPAAWKATGVDGMYPGHWHEVRT